MELTRTGDSDKAPQLREHVLVGRSAALADLVTICLMAGVVFLIHSLARGTGDIWTDLYVPLLALGLGALGALTADKDSVGYVRTPGYVAVYLAAIAAMIAVDFAVRSVLGGNLAAILPNWAVLIGSASAVNLFLKRIPLLTARRWLSESNLSRFHPVALLILVLMQGAQTWISVLGAPWGVVVVQLLARRLVILVVTHLISRRSYGPEGARMLREHKTLEYVGIRAVADADGKVADSDASERIDQAVVGMILLKLPIFGGESMAAGRKSLTRIADKLLFVEQMLAFSSPTLVVSRSCALGHIAFLQAMLSLDGDPAARNRKLADQHHCKAEVLKALRGQWAEFRANS